MAIRLDEARIRLLKINDGTNTVKAYTNTVSSYGGLALEGYAKGGYNGIHLGSSKNYLTVMSGDNHQGLYNETNGKWIIYYSRTSNAIGIGNSDLISGYSLTVGGATYLKGRLVVKGDGSSYNEGIRILPASNGWSNVFFSANTTTEGTHDSGWLIGRRGAAGSIAGAVGDFTIEEEDSSGANLTIHKNAGGATLRGTLKVTSGNIHINSSAGNGTGLGLYSTTAPTTYGIHMSTTANYGKFGDVQSDWATYFNMNAVGQRGWIYRAGSTNVASISANGIGAFKGITTSNRGNSDGLYTNSGLEIREYNYSGAGTDSWGQAPRLSFHWSGRNAAQIGVASNGYLYTAPSTGTTFYKLVYESGTWGIGISGNAATASALTAITTTDAASSSATWRRIWMSYSNNTTGRPAYDDRFAIQTSTGTLKAPTFSGALSGNATTASSWATARTLTLAGDLSGSVSVKGNADMTLTAVHYCSAVGSDNTSSYPYHRIAYITNKSGSYSDTDCILDIKRNYDNAAFGRIKISFRTNGSGAAVSCNARWIYRSGFAADDITIAWWGVTGNACYADVFLKVGSWARTTIYQPYGYRSWTLVSSSEGTDGTNPTEAYTSVAAAGTALHGKAYTSTAAATDTGIVNSANVATKLGTSTIGATDRPIYLNSGTATQTTYRMAATNATATSALAITSDLPTGIWYVSGTSGILGQSDGVVIANQYNSSWITEIYQDYRTGQLAVRGKNNGTWQGWRKVLDSSNYSSYALPISGGTMGGVLNAHGGITLNSSTAQGTLQYILGIKAFADGGNVLWQTASDVAVGRASLLSIHNTVTSTTTRSANASSWTGGISGVKYIWGQAFKDTSIGTDTGDIVFAVRAGQYTSGGTELCVCIDGDYYSMGNKVLHAGNYSSYALSKGGGTLNSGSQILRASSSQSWVNGRKGALLAHAYASANRFTNNQYNPLWSAKSINGSWDCGTYTANNNLYFTYITDANFDAGANNTTHQVIISGVDGSLSASKIYGAVWNDYAEYRWVLNHPDTDEPLQPGRCVAENGNDSLSLTHERLQPGAKIISDTYGMCMGETEKAKTPIAVCGRVLAYPFERKVAFHAGDAVCSGPNGTVSKMSREEVMMYPERIVGTVVSKPTYKEWGPNKIPVDGRIWIQVK